MTFDSQDSIVQEQRLGQALRDIRDQNKAHFEKSVEDEVPLFDGGDSFDWNQHAIDSLGFQWNENVKTWLGNISNEIEEQLVEYADNFNLPEINLLYANPLQRVIISMNIRKLLEVARKGIGNVPPLRLLIQGTGGTGKTFVITAIS